MITEDYVSFDTAKFLKEKGFNEKCSSVWRFTSDSPKGKGKWILYGCSMADENSIWNPTLQMAIKWLMEKKGIAIIPVLSSILDNEKFLWDIKIVVAKTGKSYSQGWIYEKQEDAFDTAIKYCLKNLI